MNRNELAEKFHHEMFDNHVNSAEECHWRLLDFLRMIVEHGAVRAAKMHINSSEESDGFTKIRGFGRLDLSFEANAIKKEYETLFTAEERAAAKERLEKHGYEFGQMS